MRARDLVGVSMFVLGLVSGCAGASSRRVAAGPSPRWIEETPVRTPEGIAYDEEQSALLPDSYGRHERFDCPRAAQAELATFACYAAKRTPHQGFHTHGGHGRRVR